MISISTKVAYPIILAGLFVIVAFVALNYQTMTPLFYVILLLLTTYIFLFGFATGQKMAAPIKKLTQRADELSRGNLKSRFYAEGKDEFTELSKAFNRIAEEFEITKAKTDQLEKAVDIKVQARTHALEETITALEQKVRNRTSELQKVMDDMQKSKAEPKPREATVEQPVEEQPIAPIQEEVVVKKERAPRKPKKAVPAPAPGDDIIV